MSGDQDDLRVDWTRVGQLAELGLLSASLLHELRQPLLAIQATAELAISHGTDDEARWRRVLEHLRHLRGLLDAYGGLSRQDGPVQRLDVLRVVRAAALTLAPHARGCRVQVRVEGPEVPVDVRMRETALRQVLVNLLHNAVDATQDAGGAEVVVSVEGGADAVQVCIEDQGPGIAPERLQDVFQPFVSDKAPGRGTGLGLYIAKTLVEEAGGGLVLGPAPRGGTRAAITLPKA